MLAAESYEDLSFQPSARPPVVATANATKFDARGRFARLVAPTRSNLLRYAIWLSRDPDLAQEIVQETMLRAWRALDSLKDERSIVPWLFKIARREHARCYERKRVPVCNLDFLSEDDKLAASFCEDHELLDIRYEILTLSRIYREPLILQVLLGFSLKEIADLLGISVSNVAVRLHRARTKLAERFQDDKSEELPATDSAVHWGVASEQQ